MTRVLLALALLWPALVSAQVTQLPFGATPPIVGLPAFNPSSPITPTSVGVPASTCAAPGIYLTTAPTNGMVFTATPSVILCVNGVAILTTTSSAVTSTVPLRGPVGSAAATSFNFGTAGTGLYQAIDTSGLGLASNGFTVAIAYANAAVGFQIAQDYPISFASAADGSTRKILWTNTAPTIASGFGTSPSIPNSNGTASFSINVGTGGVATGGVITLPAASNGWNISCENLTSAASLTVAKTAGTTTSVTIASYSRTTGLLTAFNASDIIECIAVAR